MTQPRSRIASVVGLIIALGSAFLIPFLPGQAHQNIADARQDTGVVVFEWIVAIVILAIVIFWERLPLRSIGFRKPSGRDFLAMGAAFVAMVVALGIFLALTHTSGSAFGGVSPAQIAAVPLALRVALFLTAGFCEELMFRAYAIERLALFSGKLWIGGVAAVVLFTLGHLPRYGFSLALLVVAIIATFLTGLYLWRRNFWICALMHAVIDCIGLVVRPALAAHGH
ncbi:MAG: type II CAAX endopeptidase family protein [Vulcanimicrobiaceae bacterium]